MLRNRTPDAHTSSGQESIIAIPVKENNEIRYLEEDFSIKDANTIRMATGLFKSLNSPPREVLQFIQRLEYLGRYNTHARIRYSRPDIELMTRAAKYVLDNADQFPTDGMISEEAIREYGNQLADYAKRLLFEWATAEW